MVTESSKTAISKSDLHKAHRARVKEKFRKYGLDSFHDHNVLELLLFYAIPRTDTNEIAHMLINEFGSFQAVFEAPIEALQAVKGIGPEAATLIKLLGEFISYYEGAKTTNIKHIKSSEDAYKFLKKYYMKRGPEKFVVVYLNGRTEVITVDEITQGSDSMVHTDFTTIIQKAILLKAKGIVISHNHDQGFSTPSHEDRILTEKLSKLLDNIDVILCEHIIFCYGMEPTFMSKLKSTKKGILAF